jgi:hypothetical protein
MQVYAHCRRFVAGDWRHDCGALDTAELVAACTSVQRNDPATSFDLSVCCLQEILQALDTNLPPALRAKCIPFLNGFA